MASILSENQDKDREETDDESEAENAWLKLGIPTDPEEANKYNISMVERVCNSSDIIDWFPHSVVGLDAKMENQACLQMLKHCHPDRHRQNGEEILEKSHIATTKLQKLRKRGFPELKRKRVERKVEPFSDDEKKTILLQDEFLRAVYTLMTKHDDEKAITWIEAYNTGAHRRGPQFFTKLLTGQYKYAQDILKRDLRSLSGQDCLSAVVVLQSVVKSTQETCDRYNYPQNFAWPSSSIDRPPGPVTVSEKNDHNSDFDCKASDEIDMSWAKREIAPARRRTPNRQVQTQHNEWQVEEAEHVELLSPPKKRQTITTQSELKTMVEETVIQTMNQVFKVVMEKLEPFLDSKIQAALEKKR